MWHFLIVFINSWKVIFSEILRSLCTYCVQNAANGRGDGRYWDTHFELTKINLRVREPPSLLLSSVCAHRHFVSHSPQKLWILPFDLLKLHTLFRGIQHCPSPILLTYTYRYVYKFSFSWRNVSAPAFYLLCYNLYTEKTSAIKGRPAKPANVKLLDSTG